jgi:hypothetical protein
MMMEFGCAQKLGYHRICMGLAQYSIETIDTSYHVHRLACIINHENRFEDNTYAALKNNWLEIKRHALK